nr:glyoxysomal fatty acid beta-oxidation multifunctional protein MFP-A [Ipomoea batatas]
MRKVIFRKGIADGFILENTSSPLGVLLIIFHGLMYLFRFRALTSCNELISIGELGIPCLPDHIASNILLLFSAVKGRPSKAIVDALALFGVQIYVVDRVTFQVFTHLGAKGKFSGGFDITAFGGLTRGKVAAPKPSFVSVEILTDIVEASRKPPVAAIDGLALGGGLEIAMGVIVLKRSIFSVSAIPSLRA